MGLSSTKTKSTQTSTPNVPDWIQGNYGDYSSMLKDFAGTTPTVTGPSPLQKKAFSMVGQAPTLNDLAPDMNPFTQGVIDQGVNDLDLARRRALNGNSSNATLSGGSGAWMGDRAGVADSLTNEGFLNSVGDLTSSLRSAGYDRAITNRRQRISDMAELGDTQQGFDAAANPYNVQSKRLATLAQLLQGLNPGLFTGQTTTGTSTQSGGLGGLSGFLGGVGSLFGGLGALKKVAA